MQPPAPRAALARARRVRGYGLGEGVAGVRLRCRVVLTSVSRLRVGLALKSVFHMHIST